MSDLERLEKLEAEVAGLKAQVEELEQRLNEPALSGGHKFKALSELHRKVVQLEKKVTNPRR